MGIWHSGPQENMHIVGHLCDVPQTSYLVHASYYKFKKALHENQANVHFHQITWLEGVLLEGALHICAAPAPEQPKWEFSTYGNGIHSYRWQETCTIVGRIQSVKVNLMWLLKIRGEEVPAPLP